jgi:hypothetical protein
MIPVQLYGSNSARVFVHSNPDVDIAVIPGVDVSVLPKAIFGDYKIRAVDESLFVSADHFRKKQIQMGDEVFFTGFFRSFYGATRNYPILRFGRLSLVSEEKIPWNGKMLDLYLVEARSFGGNSGSPVFFRPSVERSPGSFVVGGPTLLLGGVLKGYFGEPTGENSGIAGVVPASHLREILYADEAKKQRASPIKAKPLNPDDLKYCMELETKIRKALKQ